MRISRIDIKSWRNFENVAFDVPDDASLVCLVGENGTGKSNVLELLAGIAQHIGLSSGNDAPRGSPFSDDHHIFASLTLPRDRAGLLGPNWAALPALQAGWTGKLTIEFKNGTPIKHIFEGCAANSAAGYMDQLREALRGSSEIRYLLLDADRSYPPSEVAEHQLGDVLKREWESDQWKKQRAFYRTSQLYSEWVQYLVGKHSQAADAWDDKCRIAAETGQALPAYTPSFSDYRASLTDVLPHLKFVNAARKERTAIFETAGTQLRFHQLSGGEREIAFMVGQISRFDLQRGLFLIDEPELHLNPELVRRWVTWLRTKMVDGQTWLATHSLEAAEAAGPENVFVLERPDANNPKRLVKSVQPMARQPILQTLAGAVGSPAFSIARHKFVWIEGEPAGGEKTRFYSLFGKDKALKFIEAGNCHEVERKVGAVREVATMSGQPIRTLGIIDRDFRSSAELGRLSAAGFFVLPCHEIENLFLHPATLSAIATKIGLTVKPIDMIVAAHDEVAGMWIFQHACAAGDFSALDLRTARSAMSALDWNAIHGAGPVKTAKQALNQVVDTTGLKFQFLKTLARSCISYGTERAAANFWRDCMGKQVLLRIPKALGLATASGVESAVATAWTDDPALCPPEYAAVAAALAAV